MQRNPLLYRSSFSPQRNCHISFLKNQVSICQEQNANLALKYEMVVKEQRSLIREMEELKSNYNGLIIKGQERFKNLEIMHYELQQIFDEEKITNQLLSDKLIKKTEELQKLKIQFERLNQQQKMVGEMYNQQKQKNEKLQKQVKEREQQIEKSQDVFKQSQQTQLKLLKENQLIQNKYKQKLEQLNIEKEQFQQLVQGNKKLMKQMNEQAKTVQRLQFQNYELKTQIHKLKQQLLEYNLVSKENNNLKVLSKQQSHLIEQLRYLISKGQEQFSQLQQKHYKQQKQKQSLIQTIKGKLEDSKKKHNQLENAYRKLKIQLQSKLNENYWLTSKLNQVAQIKHCIQYANYSILVGFQKLLYMQQKFY